MREILFRGKNQAFEWEYGYLIYSEHEDRYYIGTMELLTPVIPETVGEWTGCVDVNGVKIFEGDIVSIKIPKQKEFFVEIYYENCGLVIGFGKEQESIDFTTAIEQCAGKGHKLEDLMEVIDNIHNANGYTKNEY